MKLCSITIGGFKNLKTTKLSLENMVAIISPNNYGKSNLLDAIDFGVEFLNANISDRKAMMAWIPGIPINRTIENDEFYFEIEFLEESLNEYQYVKYGYTFSWFRDNGTGQKITNEWIETRSNKSVRYTSYLKRSEGKYRKEKSTSSFRKILLADQLLAIDVLPSIDDIAINPVINAIKNIKFHVCSSLDLKDRYITKPFEYIDDNEDIAIDDDDVPKALFKLQQTDIDKYNLFLESVYSLFPEFVDVIVKSYEIKHDSQPKSVVFSTQDSIVGTAIESQPIPFRIKDEIYRLFIRNKYLNQQIDISRMSTGTKRIFWLLANIFIASSKGLSFIGVEELETSIHPKLLKSLLENIDEALLDNTSLIISSHSPFLVQYLKPEKIYVGIPTNDGTAEFKQIRSSKVKNLVRDARNLEMAVGEYLFDLMAGDLDASEILSFYLED